MRAFITIAIVCFGIFTLSAHAQTTTIDEHCVTESGKSPLRQTVLVIDGSMIVPDSEEGPAKKNQLWRSFMRNFVDAQNRQFAQLMAPKERITIAIANADGSGLSILFSGCVPYWTNEDIAQARSTESTFKKFFGQDWATKLQESQEDFRRAASIITISGIKNVPIGAPEARVNFSDSGMIASLRRSPGFNTQDGLVRYILLTNFENAILPVSDVITARRSGKEDGAKSNIDLNQSDVYLFGDGSGGEASKLNYLEMFFLSSGAELISLGGLSSTITDNRIPITSRVFQGTADFPKIGKVPIKLRLATDKNNRVVMSWFQEQRRAASAIPVRGAITCNSNDVCTFQGDQVFAQIWSENPDTNPECTQDMPMAGMRDLKFTIEGEKITGAVSDIVCVIVGREDVGLRFELGELKGNR